MSTVCTVHLLFPLRNSAPNLNLNFSYIQWSYLFKSQYFNVPISWSLCCFIWISHMLSLKRLIKPISARWLKCITSFILTSNTRSPKAKSKWSKNKTKQNKTKQKSQITRTTGSLLFILTTEMSLDEFCHTLSVISSDYQPFSHNFCTYVSFTPFS